MCIRDRPQQSPKDGKGRDDAFIAEVQWQDKDTLYTLDMHTGKKTSEPATAISTKPAHETLRVSRRSREAPQSRMIDLPGEIDAHIDKFSILKIRVPANSGADYIKKPTTKSKSRTTISAPKHRKSSPRPPTKKQARSRQFRAMVS